LDSLPKSKPMKANQFLPTTRQPKISKQTSPALSFAKTIFRPSSDPDQADQAFISVKITGPKYRAAWTACRNSKQ
jgi:hypothetical protein